VSKQITKAPNGTQERLGLRCESKISRVPPRRV